MTPLQVSLSRSRVGYDYPLMPLVLATQILVSTWEKLLQELHEAVSDGMKVIVVKKRQLQLYAGQPFADVETALHSLVDGDQSATANSR